METEEGSLWTSFNAHTLGGARETLSLLRWSCVSKDENLCLDDLVADPALWIIVWLGAETGLVCFL